MTENVNRPGTESLLYQRFNGVMLGFFAQQASFRVVRPQFPALRDQTARFLEEIGIDLEIPTDPDAFADMRNEIFGAVMDSASDMRQLQVAVGLGYMFGGQILGTDPESKSSIAGGMGALGVDEALLEELRGEVDFDDSGRPDFDSMMSAGLKLASAAIRDCPEEPTTCFVAMPFRDPFPDRYQNAYRSLLAKHGLTAIRAWGGMSNEAHHELLVSVISRCGWCLAELTDSNPNVTYELGYATGRRKALLAVMDTNPDLWVSWANAGEARKLSNLRGIAVMPYDSSEAGWESEFIDGIGTRYVSVMQKIFRDAGYSVAREGGVMGYLRKLGRLFRTG